MIIRDPNGRRFDTVNRIFIDEPIGSSLSQNSRSNSASVYSIPDLGPAYNTRTRRHRNIWGRINDFIAGIGEWFDENASSFSNNISSIFYIGAWIVLGIGVIVQLFSSGFGSALITAIIGGIVVYFGAGIVMVILMYVLWVFFKILRYVFYNIYTLLLVITISIGVYFSNRINLPVAEKKTSTSVSVTLRPNYYCNATTYLNVRENSHLNARVIGQLKRYEEIYVYSYSSSTGFAEIDFKGKKAFVSAEYLRPKDASITNNLIPRSVYEN